MKTLFKLTSVAALCAASAVAYKTVKKKKSSTHRSSKKPYPCKAYHCCGR